MTRMTSPKPYLLRAGEVTDAERPETCRSDNLWELIGQMTAEAPADRPSDIAAVIGRLKAMQADDTHTWYLKADNRDNETLTDVLERKTEEPDELFGADDSDSDQALPQAPDFKNIRRRSFCYA